MHLNFGAGDDCLGFHGQLGSPTQEKLDRIEPWTSLEARVTKQNLLNFGHIMRRPVPGEGHLARAGKWKEGERSPKLIRYHQK